MENEKNNNQLQIELKEEVAQGTVSYTHLDVYKRQLKERMQILPLSPIPVRNLLLILCV